MSLSNRITNQAKLDSRRFAKGVACRIVSNTLWLSFIRSRGLYPINIVLGVNGYNVITSRLLAIPLQKWREAEELFESANILVSTRQNIPKPESLGQSELRYRADIAELEKIQGRQESLIAFLRQNLVLVYLPNSKLPAGEMIPDPSVYDIVIDSIDVSQSVDAELILKVKNGVRNPKTWNK